MRLTRHPAHTQSGFTFYELMITIVIISIGAVLALPSFSDAIERNRIAAQTNELMAAFNFARTEAIRSNAQVVVCGVNAANNGCEASNWNRGWLIYRPVSATDSAVATVLRVYELSSKDKLSGPARIHFGPRGQLVTPTAATTLDLQPQTCATSKEFRRRFSVSVTGTSTHTKGNCT